ncbi:hypothetical protein CVT25_000298 [Psilocybe cyanescens]|uniref:Uncharacterized protein n=1 Tax=Psilocybe cyanescens TaxID=93625 RepID=A0A409XU36_PSICY|nr:hypothetical protein CVT25_000298 [Psilocybe cyanescens]
MKVGVVVVEISFNVEKEIVVEDLVVTGGAVDVKGSIVVRDLVVTGRAVDGKGSIVVRDLVVTGRVVVRVVVVSANTNKVELHLNHFERVKHLRMVNVVDTGGPTGPEQISPSGQHPMIPFEARTQLVSGWQHDPSMGSDETVHALKDG